MSDKQASRQPKVVLLTRYTREARVVLAAAQTLADEMHHEQMTLLHVLSRCLDESSIDALMRESGADVTASRNALEAELTALEPGTQPSYMSSTLLAILSHTEKQIHGRELTHMDVVLAVVGTDAIATAEHAAGHAIRLPEVHAIRRVVAAGQLERVRRADA